MSDRRGGFRIAAIVIAIGSMFVLAALNNERYDCARYKDGAADPSQRPGSCVVSDRLPIAAPAQFPRAPDQSYQGDLEAQQWMAWSAFLMVFVSITGVVLIALTLRETGQLLVATQNATDAANRTVDATKRIGEAQVRAYLAGFSGGFQIVKEKILVDLTFRNEGQSPAIGGSAEISFVIWRKLESGIRETLTGEYCGGCLNDRQTIGAIAVSSGVSLKSEWYPAEEMKWTQLFAEISAPDTKFGIQFIVQFEWRDVFSQSSSVCAEFDMSGITNLTPVGGSLDARGTLQANNKNYTFPE